MDRRYINAGVTNSIRTSSSFIPTTVPHSQHTKLPQHQIQQLALQSQLQAQSHSQLHLKNSSSVHDPPNSSQNYYQNTVANNRHLGTLPIRNNNSVSTNSQLHQQQHVHSRNQNSTKQFSSHYGNTTSNGANNSNATIQVPSNGNIYYGSLAGHNQNVSSIPNWRYAAHPQHQNQKELQIPTIQPVIKQIQQQHLSNKISQHYQPAETEGLPQTLVDSMRTLFDILDDTKVGKIRLSDIETRWECQDGNGPNGYKMNTGAEPLIKMGVMGYLKKVTPPDGLLTFDRFCAGLRLALLTNNNNPLAPNNIFITQPQSPQQSPVISQTNPQFSLQQHVRNMTSNLLSANNMQQNAAHQLANTKSYNNNNSNNNILENDNHSPMVSTGNNSPQRISKIPSISASRLPMPNSSGLGASPNNRQTVNSFVHAQNGNASSMVYHGGINRSNINAEQGTTIALVHQAPNQTSLYSKSSEASKQHKQSSSSSGFGKENRQAAKNASLDNLIADNANRDRESTKDRPPSAPLLDANDSFEGENEQPYYKNVASINNNNKSDRARSRDKDTEERNLARRKSPAEESTFGKRIVSFVTPRQRTLSMPQLQVNKLKPKSVNMDIDMTVSPDTAASPQGGKHHTKGVTETSFKSNKVSPTLVSGISGINKQKSDSTLPESTKYRGQTKGLNDNEQPQPPPKPPRNNTLTITTTMPNNLTIQEAPLSGSSAGSGTLTPSKPEIRNVLQSWQKGKADKKPDEKGVPNVDESIPVDSVDIVQSTAGKEVKGKGEKKTNLRRRETPRRHTVQSGIDFATLKRLKQLEQERDILQQGTAYIDTTKEWYLKQLDTVDEKISLLTKGAPTSDYWSDCHEEKLNLLGCRVSEVNSLLTVLMDSSARLPQHMNLQIPSHLSMKTITRLKDQNRQLTQEVSDCGHRVTQLETEKAMLLRQLFHQKNNIHPDETVYM